MCVLDNRDYIYLVLNLCYATLVPDRSTPGTCSYACSSYPLDSLNPKIT